MDRRDFLKRAAAAGGVGLLAGGLSPAEAEAIAAGKALPKETVQQALAAWTKQMWDLGACRVYRGAELEHIAMPLGGFGAGQVYLTGRGRLDGWQILNNFNRDVVAEKRWRNRKTVHSKGKP
jgi:hypothetical protein